MSHIPYIQAEPLADLVRQRLIRAEKLEWLLVFIQQMPNYDKCWCPELDVKRAVTEDGFCPGCQARAQVAEITGENQ